MLITSFTGTNRDFRTWLAAQRPANVVSLAEYKKKKAAKEAAKQKPVNPSIA